MPNQLASEKSLYLRQHADNPVSWYPWCEAAFAAARERDCPVLISIGYSSCHWCHVMEHESFESAEVAELQNRSLVSIKVDREERPDVDQIYMTACHLVSGQGGWPLNVFVTPDGRPFFAGTYFPPTPRWGRPSWSELLEMIADAWVTRRDEVERSADSLAAAIRTAEQSAPAAARPVGLEQACAVLVGQIDRQWGGFGSAPKFPSVPALELLLRGIERGVAPQGRELLKLTLDRMFEGGMYDHVGGGFSRYSVDREWAVPHFEKMLYDNGLLLRLYADAQRVLQDARIPHVLRDIAGFLVREMRAPRGGFYSSLDADSGGEEGSYYVWSPDDMRRVLGEEVGSAMSRFFGVTEAGNFEHTGKTVLSRRISDEDFARAEGVDIATVRLWIADARCWLFGERDRRPRPARDEKRIAAWNALAIQGLARTGAVLGDADIVALATQAGGAVIARLIDKGGQVHRLAYGGPDQFERGGIGFLDDHAYTILAFVDLFGATGEARWLDQASSVAAYAADAFFEPAQRSFVLTAADAEALIARPSSAQDEAMPSATVAMVLALLRLSVLTGRGDLESRALEVLSAHAGTLSRTVVGAATAHRACDVAVAGVRTLVVALPAAASEAQRRDAIRQAHHAAMPDDVVVVAGLGVPLASTLDPSLVDGRREVEEVTFFACRRGACGLPASTAAAAVASLDG